MSKTIDNQNNMQKFYDDISQKYDFIFPLSPQHKTFFKEEIKGTQVLDIGAATGNLTQFLLSEKYNVTAIDINEKLIAKAKEKGILVRQINMLKIDSLPKFSTIINIGNTLAHLKTKEEIREFLQKSYNQLDNGGKLIVQIVNFGKYLKQKDENNYLGQLPTIENEQVSFQRFYYLNQDNNIIFKTILDKSVENEEVLINIDYQELKSFLCEIGFVNILFYGGFNKATFDPENSMALIITAEKN